MTVLRTNLPAKIVDASDVVLSYFRRRPAQELQFRYKKAVVYLNRVAGYGRKKIENPRVLEAQRKAAKKIEELSRQLEKPFEQISIHEKSIADIIPKERQIRAQGTIRKGKRILSKKLQQKLENYGKTIDFHKLEKLPIPRQFLHHNLQTNSHVAFLFFEDGSGYKGK